MRNFKETIIISAIRFYEGGPLTVLINFILGSYHYSMKNDKYEFKFFVNDTSKLPNISSPYISYVEFPSARKSYFHRLFFEYIYFFLYTLKNKTRLWLSLHDISPILYKTEQVVYCHNPQPFYKGFSYLNLLNIREFMFRLVYKYFYRFNIHSNKFLIVQQEWLKDQFHLNFNLNLKKIVVAPPDSSFRPVTRSHIIEEDTFTFFYPAFPRTFKNFEVICEAAMLLSTQTTTKFNVILTINGTENLYAYYIFKKYSNLNCISFVGQQSRQQVDQYYSCCDCLLFPSKVETWGLPISEFKNYIKPIIVADLPYAHETVGDYDLVKFFKSSSYLDLFSCMNGILNKKTTFDTHSYIRKYNSYLGFDSLFNKLLKQI